MHTYISPVRSNLNSNMNKSILILLAVAVFCVAFTVSSPVQEDGIALDQAEAKGITCSLPGGSAICRMRCRDKGYSTGKCIDGTCTCRSYQGINEEIIWVSIGMGVAIAVLITIALCYIMREKCNQRREYYISA